MRKVMWRALRKWPNAAPDSEIPGRVSATRQCLHIADSAYCRRELFLVFRGEDGLRRRPGRVSCFRQGEVEPAGRGSVVTAQLDSAVTGWALAQRYKVSRNTVAKALACPVPSGRKKPPPRKSVLEPVIRILSRDGRPTELGDAFAHYGRISKTLHLFQFASDTAAT